MTFAPSRTVPKYMRRLVPAALLAAAVALGGSALGDPATADAAPEWDIGAYDACIFQVIEDQKNGKITSAQADERSRGCCTQSGGIVQPTANGGFVCGAPPANAPGRTVPPGVPKQTLTPAPAAPPPGMAPGVIQTFTPAP
jgi:hypothetical protein